MRLTRKIIPFLLIVFTALSCQYVTYTPRSKKNIRREQPSPVLLNRIIEYRQEFNGWPFSKEEFTSKGPKYKEAFAGFPYLQTRFNVIDNNTMTFTFSEHIRDRQRYQETKQVDLNSYAGEVRFYKEKDVFIWKINMR